MNLKKILLGTFAVVVSAVSLAPATNAAINDAEFTSALSWAYENGLTKYNTEDAFMPYSNITREQASKFFASYTVTNLCEVEASDNEACNFSDINAGDYSLKEYILLACELGLVRGTGGKFMPTNNLTRAEAFTILSRAMSANAGEEAPAEDGTPWYGAHFSAMQSAGITKETDVDAQVRAITRYELLLVLYRSRMEEATCSDTDITDLLEDLFGDDTTTDDEDDTDDVVTESNGMAKAMLSPATPNGATVPGLVSVKVASFDFTASTEAVVISEITVKRMGLGSDDVIQDLTAFADNEVVSKSKSFNSDDMATFVIKPAVTVQPGTTVTIDIVAKVGSAETAPVVSNEEFSIALVGFDTNGKEDTANLPLNANTFRIGGVDGAEVVVLSDGNISDVNLGDKGVEVAKFEMENNGDSDVTITQITLEDDEKNADDSLENFVLKHNGVTVGTVAKANGKFVTFVLTTPVVIGENETEDFRVYADVIAGAGEDISFVIDEATRVLGTDAKFGYGIAVDADTYGTQPFSILAGELTLVEKKLPSDLARADRDEFVLAEFELIPNAGKDLTLEEITFVLNGTANLGGDTWGDIFENPELHVIINGAVKRFDLNTSNDTVSSLTMSDDDLGIALPVNAEIFVRLVADTAKVFENDWTNGDDSFSIAMSTAFPGFEVIENEDDERVEKIVPSSITFDTVDLVTSTVVVTKLNLGTSVNVVKGSRNVDGYKFQVKPDQAGDVYAESFDFVIDETTACGLNPNSQSISAVRLWKWVGSEGTGAGGWELVEQQGGFDITVGGAVSFDNFTEIEILASKTQQFLLTLDFTDDDAIAGCEYEVTITAAEMDDDNNKPLTVTVPGVIGRTIILTAAGSVNINPELNDAKVNRAKHVLGGTTSDYVAAFDLIATNEGAILEDLEFTFAGAGAAAFTTAITEVKIFNEAGTELYSEFVSTNPVVFDNVDFEIPAGTTTIFVKVVAELIGDSSNGSPMGEVTVTMDADNVDGADSGDDINPTVGAGNSYAFDVIPVHVSNLEFVNSYGGYNVTTTYNSATTDSNLAILKVTTNTWSNTDSASPDILDLVLDTVDFTLPAGVTNVTLKRIDIANGVDQAAVAGLVTYGVDDVNNTITRGTTAYYLLQGDLAIAAGTFTVKIEDLDGGTSFIYRSTDGAYADVTRPYIGKNSLDNVVETKYQP